MDAKTTAPLARSFVRPTTTTLYWRTSVLWQLIRFIVVNLRISRMIVRSHDTHLEPGPDREKQKA